MSGITKRACRPGLPLILRRFSGIPVHSDYGERWTCASRIPPARKHTHPGRSGYFATALRVISASQRRLGKTRPQDDRGEWILGMRTGVALGLRRRSLQAPWWLIPMRREPRTGQDMSWQSASSRWNRHVGLLEDPLCQPLDRYLSDASHRPQVRSARPEVPNRHVLLQLVPEPAPHVQGGKPDPTVGKARGQAWSSS